MLGLGGNVIGFSDASNSSTSKGETLADTITVVSGYSDIIAMRHPKDGSAYVATMHSRVPVINAGDGGHNHPTQTLLDLMTIRKELGRLDNFTIGLCGDLTFGRTVHSLATALSIYDNVNFIFISPKELKMPDYIKEMLTKKGISYTEVESLEENIDKLDVLYMTRVQRERFLNEEDYVRLKDVYILDKEKLKTATGRNAYIIKSTIIELRKDQYIIKQHRKPPVQAMHLVHSEHHTVLPDDTWIDEDGNVVSEGVSLTNPTVCSIILCNYSKLRQNCYGDFFSDT
jgi:aspartate carbamoyltransferase catalytic subunit